MRCEWFGLVLIFCSCVSAIGVSTGDEAEFVLERGVFYEVLFGIRGVADGMNVVYSLEGDLAEFGNVEVVSNSSVRVSFLFDEEVMEPGEHRVYFRAQEIPNEDLGVTIAAATASRVPIKFFVPYGSVYLDVELGVGDLMLGENYGLGVEARNLGNVFMNDVEGEVLLLLGDDVVERVDLDSVDLDVGDSFVWNFDLDLERAGDYELVVDVDYLGRRKNVSRSLSVGKRGLIVDGSSSRLGVGEVSRFWVDVENVWGGDLDGVYFVADVFDSDGVKAGNVRSEVVELGGFEESRLVGFVDLNDVGKGVGGVVGVVYFDGGEVEFASNVVFGKSFGLSGLAVYGFVWVLFLFVYHKFNRSWDEG
jgi:hypothetical protein